MSPALPLPPLPQENPAGAAWLLALLGSTDWVDGWIARRFDQTSEFGKVFDPTVDRLLFIVSVTAIIIDGSIPLWFALAVLVREVVVGGVIAFSTLFLGMERFGVTWLGKCATFALMGAVPSFLLGNADVWESPFFLAVAWILGIPGLLLSYWTGIAYIPQVRHGIAVGRAAATGTTEPPPSPQKRMTMNTPDDRRYSSDHEWIQRLPGSDVVRIGITDYAQDSLGDVVFVEIPEVGQQVAASDSVTEVESTKSVSDIYAPVAGVVAEVNDALDDQPELLNSDPYGEGWICAIEMSDTAQYDALLDAAGYRALTEG